MKFLDEHYFYLSNETHQRQDYLAHRRSTALPAVRNFFGSLSPSPSRVSVEEERERRVRFVRGRVFGFEACGAGPLSVGRSRARWLRFRACCSRNRPLTRSDQTQSRSEAELRRVVKEGEREKEGGVHIVARELEK